MRPCKRYGILAIRCCLICDVDSLQGLTLSEWHLWWPSAFVCLWCLDFKFWVGWLGTSTQRAISRVALLYSFLICTSYLSQCRLQSLWCARLESKKKVHKMCKYGEYAKFLGPCFILNMYRFACSIVSHFQWDGTHPINAFTLIRPCFSDTLMQWEQPRHTKIVNFFSCQT